MNPVLWVVPAPAPVIHVRLLAVRVNDRATVQAATALHEIMVFLSCDEIPLEVFTCPATSFRHQSLFFGFRFPFPCPPPIR